MSGKPVWQTPKKLAAQLAGRKRYQYKRPAASYKKPSAGKKGPTPANLGSISAGILKKLVTGAALSPEQYASKMYVPSKMLYDFVVARYPGYRFESEETFRFASQQLRGRMDFIATRKDGGHIVIVDFKTIHSSHARHMIKYKSAKEVSSYGLPCSRYAEDQVQLKAMVTGLTNELRAHGDSRTSVDGEIITITTADHKITTYPLAIDGSIDDLLVKAPPDPIKAIREVLAKYGPVNPAAEILKRHAPDLKLVFSPRAPGVGPQLAYSDSTGTVRCVWVFSERIPMGERATIRRAAAGCAFGNALVLFGTSET